MEPVFVEKVKRDYVRLLNSTGADLAAEEFTVIEPFVCVAQEAIDDNTVGAFAVEEGIEIQIDPDDLKSGSDTFATLGAPVYFDATLLEFSDTFDTGYYLVGYVTSVKDANDVVKFEKKRYVGGTVSSSALAGEPFVKTVTLTAAAAGTAVDILLDAEVGAGRQAFVTTMLSKVDGATDWTDATATIVTIQDTAGTPVVGATFAKAQMVGNAVLDLTATGVTLGDAIVVGDGFTAAKGLQLVGDGDFTTGSDFVVTVSGYII
jgi:hypothetical protein